MRIARGKWPMVVGCFILHFSIFSSQFVVSLSAAEPPITAVAFAPDGESVVAVSQAGLHVYDWPDLKRQRIVETAPSNLHCLAFSPDGQRLAIGGGNPAEDGGVLIFSWPETELLLTINGHQDAVQSVVWQNDSRLLTASIDREIKFWDAEKHGHAILTFSAHSRSVNALCLLQDGKTLVSGGADQSVRVWDLESRVLIRSMNLHTAPVNALALRPLDGPLPMVASAAGDRTIRFWQPTIGRMVRYIRLEVEPLNIVWLNDGSRIAAASVDGHVRIIKADEGKVIQDLPTINGWAYAIATHPHDGSLVVAGTAGQIRRIDPGP